MKSTKELARELGLLRKRKHVNRLSASCSTVQTFKFLIVIDFESTCWENAKFKSQEIIEFPAVLLNTQTGEIESEFHHYVQPQEQPTLSCFCTQLTGITQDQVDNGIPINLCLRRFCHWLNKLNTEKGVICHGTVNESNQSINTTCVTWSDWDLGVCLQYECKRKQLLKPVQLNVWIDLRATYRRFYDRKPNGLNGALQDLGIEFQGREHSGVDDARNTAKLAYRMIRDGCVMNNTRNMKDHTRTMSLPTSILLPVRKTPPRKAKEKTSSTVCQGETTKIGPVDNRHVVGVSSSCVNRSFKNIDEPCHLSNGIIPLRRTPPRKAKEKSVKENSNVQNSLSDSRVSIAEIVPMDVTNKGVKTSTADTNCDCEDVCLCQDLEQFLSECDNICIPSDPASTGTVKLSKAITSQKRKILPSDKRESLALNSPARKIPRRISPRKFSAADIYVDKEVSDGNSKTLTSRTTSIGLKVLDTNKLSRSNETLNLKKSDTECFKKPNAVCGMITPSTARTPTCVKPHVSNRISLSRLSNTSSSVSLKVNRPSVSCPTTPAHGNNTGFQTPSFGSKSMPLSNSSASSMKMTPPLCKCGRRSKRRMVQSPGQNMGRFFFSCSVRKRVGSNEGCDFFKWETSMTNNTAQSHGSAAIMKQFVTPLSRSVTSNNSTFSQKRSLGIKSNTSQTMCIR